MAGPVYGLGASYVAASAITQFRAVKRGPSEGQVTAVTAIGDKPVGICQDEITAGDVTNGRVACVWGQPGAIARCIAGSALAYGDDVRVDAAGRMVVMAAATTNQWRVGVVETVAAAIGEHIDVKLTLDQIDT